MKRVFHWHRIVIAGMDMVQVILPDGEHILEQESRFFSVKDSKDDSKTSSVLLYPFVMEGPELLDART